MWKRNQRTATRPERGKPENSTAPTSTLVQREQRRTGACWGSLGLPDYGRMLRRARLTGAAAWLRRAPIRRRLAQPAALCGLASPGRAPERGSNLQPSDDRDTTFCATSGLLAAWVCMDRGVTIDLVRSATPSLPHARTHPEPGFRRRSISGLQLILCVHLLPCHRAGGPAAVRHAPALARHRARVAQVRRGSLPRA